MSATPLCPHFGTCGGCTLQHLSLDDQLARKRTRLESLLAAANLTHLPPITTHAAEPYHYRNRIRLRVIHHDATFALGYNLPGDGCVLPITECPIAAPALWLTAQAVLHTATTSQDLALWLTESSELELFADDTATKLQLTLYANPRTRLKPRSLAVALDAIVAHMPPGLTLAGVGAIACDLRTGPTGRTLAEAGSPGLNIRVLAERYWLTRGAFFQVNRFLLPTLVELVTADATGTLAWDLFAGVGLFARVLAYTFTHVTAVESSPTAVADLRAALTRLGPQHTAVESSVTDFLRRAVLDRDRPDLVVLDPPRAGLGEDSSVLLTRIAPQHITYVSCDPETLARDLRILTVTHTVTAIHLVDLFPQTAHQETVVHLTRTLA